MGWIYPDGRQIIGDTKIDFGVMIVGLLFVFRKKKTWTDFGLDALPIKIRVIFPGLVMRIRKRIGIGKK